MAEIRYLNLANVLRLHRLSIERFGGADGVRDEGLLESAIAMPPSTFGGQDLHPDFPSKAAAYMFHISQAHAFVDGNKRTAMAAALAFIRLNGFDVDANNEQLILIGMGVAAGQISKDELTEKLREIIIEADG